MILIEGIAMCFLLLIICVIGTYRRRTLWKLVVSEC
jgi:hypothetical protein